MEDTLRSFYHSPVAIRASSTYNQTTEDNKVTKIILVPSPKALKVQVAGLLLFLTASFFTLKLIFFFTLASYLSLSKGILVYLLLVILYTVAVWLTISGSKTRYNCRRYEINQDTVITFDGILSCKQRVNNMKGMIGMELVESSIGKIFNYGTITLKFLGGAEVHIIDIDNPEVYIPKITEIANKGSTTI